MSALYQSSKTSSPGACSRCKDSKKKCDRLLPSCSRCTRLWKACAYESHQNSMILDRRLPNAPFSGSYEQQQTSDLLLADKDFSFPSLPVPWPTMYNSPATNLLQQLPTCILDLLVREDIRISQCYKTYFSTVAPRLPIISQKEFLYKISRTSPGHDSYLSLLVLCMGLIVRSSLKPDESNLPGTIYYTAKSFFTILSSNGRLCLEVVQAGCLIAYYEYCQALFEAASSTIWTCTEMGYILGLHKMLSPSFSFDMADRITVESGRCVWWSIFIFERMVAIEQLHRKPTFKCRTPSLDDLVPFNIDAPIQSVGHLTDTGVHISAVTMKINLNPEFWTFAQAAQAAFMLDIVIEYIFNISPDEEDRLEKAATIDQQLQTFLITMMHQPKIEGLDVCLAYTLALSTLLILNNHRLCLQRLSSSNSKYDSSAVQALRSFTIMGVQTVELGDSKITELIFQFPFWTTFMIYMLAVILRTSDELIFGVEEQVHGLKLIEDYLYNLEKRWRIAGHYLDKLKISKSTELHLSRSHLLLGEGKLKSDRKPS